MGYGGATWNTAGPLNLGSGNTFDFADTTEVGTDTPHNHAWWTYTATTTAVLTLNTFTTTGTDPESIDTLIAVFDQATEPADLLERIADNDDATDTLLSELSLDVIAGTTYHILVGSYDTDGNTITTYGLSASKRDYAYTPWSTQFRDRDDNLLVISGDQIFSTGDLQNDNPPDYQTQFWFPQALRSVADASFPLGGDIVDMGIPPGRRGNYRIQEVVSGADVIGADACAWNHTRNGDQDSQLWNGSTTDSEDSSDPVCRVLGTGAADPETNSVFASYELDYGAGSFGVAPSMEGAEEMVARGLWVLPVRDNLPVWGVLDVDDLDPEAAGLPTGVGAYAVEWEDGLELTGLHYQGDRLARATPVATGTRIFLNDGILPGYTGGDPGTETPGGWSDHWLKGAPGVGADDDFVYTNEASDWREYAPITSFDDCNDPIYEAPDVTVGLCVDGTPVVDAPTYTSNSDIAFRFTLRAPRFRLRYLPITQAVPPRRIFQRSDGATHGARRVLGGGNTIQAGNRAIGGIL